MESVSQSVVPRRKPDEDDFAAFIKANKLEKALAFFEENDFDTVSAVEDFMERRTDAELCKCGLKMGTIVKIRKALHSPLMTGEKPLGQHMARKARASLGVMAQKLEQVMTHIPDSPILGKVASSDLEKRVFLILGCSQHGKSTVIRALRDLQFNTINSLSGQPSCSVAKQPVTGSGDKAQTSTVDLWPLYKEGEPTHLLSCARWENMEEAREKVQLRASEKTEATQLRMLKDLWNKDKSYQADVKLLKPLDINAGDVSLDNVKPEKFLQIELIDTPGLESSDGKDDEYMEQVLESLTIEGYGIHGIAGILLVSKMGIPFTPQWYKHVHRYWSQFKPLQKSWVFLHTACDPTNQASGTQRQQADTCFEHVIIDRQKTCMKYFEEPPGEFYAEDSRAMHESLMQAPHIFLENFVPVDDWGAELPGSEMIKYWQVVSTNKLLIQLANLPSIRLCSMTYAKGPRMKEIDARMDAALTSEINTSVKTMKELDIEVSTFMKWWLENSQRIAVVQGRLDLVNKELEGLDTEDYVPIAREPLMAEGSFFRGILGKTEAKGKVVVQRFSRDGMKCRVSNLKPSDKVKVTHEDECIVSDSAVKFERTVKSDNFFWWYGVQCEMVVLVMQKFAHVDVIEGKKRLKAELEVSVSQENESLAKNEALKSKTEEKQNETENRMQLCQSIRNWIRRDMTLDEFKTVKHFYRDAAVNNWTGVDCIDKFKPLAMYAGLLGDTGTSLVM